MTRYRYDNVLEMVDIRNSSDPGWPRVPRDSGSLKRSGEFSSPPTENMWLPFIEWNYWKLLMNHSHIKVWDSDVSSAQIKILSRLPAVIQLTKKWHASNDIDHLVAHDKIAWPGHVWFWVSRRWYWLIHDGTGSVWGCTGWYLVELGQYGAVLIGIWWYWVSITR